MEQNLRDIDWSLLQTFLAVAETGSLSAAARKIGQSQPTVGRQIRAIETALGVGLFLRQPRGLSLNETGADLLPHVQRMRDSAARISLVAAGQSQTLSGVVRITASIMISHYSLPKIIADIRQKEPQITLELVPSDGTENLLFREADIAIRMYPPAQEDVIAKKIGTIKIGLFAHRDYLKIHGAPTTLDNWKNHAFVGYDRDTQIIDGMKALGMKVTRDFFSVRCDQQSTYWELVRAGCGIGVSQLKIGLNDPDMVQIMPELPLPSLPVWLAAPMALRNTPRIRRVYDLLANSAALLTDA